MSDLWVNIGLVLLFVVVGGVFAAAEMSLVALRSSQIDDLARSGRRGERAAALAADPNRFLAAIQIGVTVAGFLSAAFGAATLADRFVPVLTGWGVPESWASPVALVSITVVISYLSLVLGELTPKRLALQRPERIARTLGPPMAGFARVMRPFVWLLSVSTDAMVRLLGGDPTATRDALSDRELRAMVAGHAGLSPEERELIDDVFDAGERTLREVMVPRTEVDFLDADATVADAIAEATELPHSRYPVVGTTEDEVIGFVHVRDLLDPAVRTRSAQVRDLTRPVLRMPDTKLLLPALTEMRRGRHQLAIVVDEYGGTAGIATLEDLVEEIVGDIGDEYDRPVPGARRTGSAVEVDGLLNLEDFAEETGCHLPEGPYETAAGFLVGELGRLPAVGDTVAAAGFRLTVTELDGKRIARVSVVPTEPGPDADAAGADTMPPR